MFSIEQKRQIADAVQKILRETNHPELPTGEIEFHLHVAGAESWSWADIKNNGSVVNPDVNLWNERQVVKCNHVIVDPWKCFDCDTNFEPTQSEQCPNCGSGNTKKVRI